MKKFFSLSILFVVGVTLIILAGCQSGGQNKEAAYVGSKKCRQCHAREYQGWQETLHSQGIKNVDKNPKAVWGNFKEKSKVRTFDLKDVAYTFGVQWKQRYLTKKGNDFLILPAQWNFATNEWKPYEAEEWKDRPFSKKCSGCHTTGVVEGNLHAKEFNVGCEDCHGPGSNHVNASEEDKSKTIVNPAKLPSDIGAMVCGRCHTRGKDKKTGLSFAINYRPGDYLFNTFDLIDTKDKDHFFNGGLPKAHHLHYIDWRQSAHAQHGITCISCHTVHSTGLNNKLQTKLPGSSLCLSCHQALNPVRIHATHTFGSCVDCHMPKLAKSAIQGDIHLHTFKIVPPSATIKNPDVRNSCNSCHKESPERMEKLYESIVSSRGNSATKDISPEIAAGR